MPSSTTAETKTQSVGVWVDGYTSKLADGKKLLVEGIMFPGDSLKYYMGKSYTKENIADMLKKIVGTTVNLNHYYGPIGSIKSAKLDKEGNLYVEIIVFSASSFPDYPEDNKKTQQRTIDRIMSGELGQLSAKFNYKYLSGDKEQKPIDYPDLEFVEFSITQHAHLEGCVIKSTKAFSASAMEQQKKNDEIAAARKLLAEVEAAEAETKKREAEAAAEATKKAASDAAAAEAAKKTAEAAKKTAESAASATPADPVQADDSQAAQKFFQAFKKFMAEDGKTSTPEKTEKTEASSSAASTSTSKPKATFVLADLDTQTPAVTVSADGSVTIPEPPPSDAEKEDLIKLGYKKEHVDSLNPEFLKQFREQSASSLSMVGAKDASIKETTEKLTKSEEERALLKRKVEEIEGVEKEILEHNIPVLKKFAGSKYVEPKTGIELALGYQAIILEQNKLLEKLAKESSVKDIFRNYNKVDAPKTAVATEAYSADKQKEKGKEKEKQALTSAKGSLAGVSGAHDWYEQHDK